MMWQRKLLLIGFLILVGITSIRAQNPLVIDATTAEELLSDWFDLRPYTSYQIDLAEEVDIRGVQDQSENWNNLKNIHPKWKQNVWLRIPLENTLNTPLELAFLLHSDQFSTWILPRENEEPQTGGNLRPRSQWDSRQHRPIFSSPHTIQFEIPAQSKQVLFVKMGISDQHFDISPRLMERSHFLDSSNQYFNRTLITQSFFHGFLWMMILYHLLIYFMNQQRAYLLFAAYTFSISLLCFYTFETHYLTAIAAFPGINRILTLLSVYAFILFYVKFLIAFLHQNQWRLAIKRLYQHFLKFLYLFGVLTILLLFLPNAQFKIVYSYWLLLPVTLIGFIGGCYVNLKYWRSEKPLARFVVANNLFLTLGMTLNIVVFYLSALQLLPIRTSGFWGVLTMELLIILHLLSFAVSLGFKSLQTERERTKLEELDQLKSRFFANISHEFRTPLTLILGPVRQLKARLNDPTQRNQLKTVENYAQKLLSMVNQILDLTKLEVDKLELSPEVFDITHLAKVITYSFSSIAEEQNISLEFNAKSEDINVYLDQEKFEQILINLISNAIKYNQEGGLVKVALDLSDKRKLVLQVADTGKGIAPEALPYIFQLYYQGKHQDLTSNQSSSGIGLALCKELIELQDGAINVESQLNRGSTFTVTIPLPEIPSELVPTNTNLRSPIQISNPQTKKSLAPAPLSEQAIILVVEDHPDIQQYIESCLADDYQLQFAGDGKKGLAMATQVIPDLIITDVMMPKMDGFTLTEKIKSNRLTSHIPLIILTGKSSKESKLEGLRKQADEYLTKPFDPEELQIRVQNLLKNRQNWIAHILEQTPGTEIKDKPLSAEERFLQEVEQIVREHLGDESFGVEQLSRALRLDRTQLFRKLKAITQQNPSYIIRSIRLKEAYQMLEANQDSIAEIAFAVGFSNPSYFNRTFKNHFGKTPGEVKKS